MGRVTRQHFAMAGFRPQKRGGPSLDGGAPFLENREEEKASLGQVLPGLEGHGILTLDLDLLAGLRIAPHAGFAVNLAEGTETDDGNLAAAFLQP